MALVGRRDGRNFGYGRQLSYAGPQALRDLFGVGHYGTVKAHSDRWQAFVRCHLLTTANLASSSEPNR